MKVLIIDNIHASLKDQLSSAGFTCDVIETTSEIRLKVLSAISRYQGLVLRSGIVVDREVIDQGSNLKFIARVGAGLEHIDKSYADSKGIQVLSSPEGNRQAVAEHALGSLLSLMNHIPSSALEVRQGKWLRKQNQGTELSGKTVGIIGYGNTGSAFAQVISGFSLDCIAYDKYVEGYGGSLVREVLMEEIFSSADVVSIHVPYNDETHYLIDDDWIDRLSNPIYLINTSRGSVVNTEALIRGLDSGKIVGACLDVVEYESESLHLPPLDQLPDAAKRLLNHPKVLLTPHIAGLTKESYEKLSLTLASKIIDGFKTA